MIEKDHIFDFVDWKKHLPKHKPDPMLWDKIASDLDDADHDINWGKAVHHLPKHKAGKDVWNNINKELNQQRSYRSIIPYFAAAACILLFGLPLYNYLLDDQNQLRDHLNTIPPIAQQLIPENDTPQTINTYNSEQASFAKRVVVLPREEEAWVVEDPFKIEKMERINIFPAPSPIEHNILVKSERNLEEKDKLEKEEVKNFNPYLLREQYLAQQTPPNLKEDKKKKWSFSAALTNATLKSNSEFISNDKINQGLALEVSYKPNKFEFNVGMEYQNVNIEQDYLASLTTTEYRGTVLEQYEESIITGYDSNNEPIYTTVIRTRENKIYDTIRSSISETKSNQYIFFKIPFSLGYQIIDQKKYYVNLKSGISLNLLVNEHQPTAKFNDAKGRLVRESAPTLSGKSINYQLQLEVETGYQIKKNMWLFGKPSLIYYPDVLPVSNISTQNQKHNFGFDFGLRFGI